MVQPVSIVRATSYTTNRYGDRVPDWATAEQSEVSGWLTATSTTETSDSREAITTEWELSLPAETDIVASDRVIADGVTYRIVGSILIARTPSGDHHLIVHLRTVEG